MELKDYLCITDEIKEALATGKPVVALESTILSHGMPYPENLEFAHRVENEIRAEGAVPATLAIIDGKLCVGLNDEQLLVMCKAENVAKASRRDVAVYLTTKQTAATTVATTMIIAATAGIKVFATGGIGGVHRGGENTMDISADLQELANTDVTVVCAGCKSILDIEKTLEYLETFGVPVLGYQTNDFPAFFCSKSGCGVDFNAPDAKTIAEIMFNKWNVGLKGGVLVGNPVPAEYDLDFDEMEKVIVKALAMADEAGVKGKKITPFLLATIKELTGGESFDTNVQLALNNARVASKIAVEYSKLG